MHSLLQGKPREFQSSGERQPGIPTSFNLIASMSENCNRLDHKGCSSKTWFAFQQREAQRDSPEAGLITGRAAEGTQAGGEHSFTQRFSRESRELGRSE